MTLGYRAGNLRAWSYKCKFCRKRYRIPGWCQLLEVGEVMLYTILSYRLNFFAFLGEKPAFIVNAVFAAGIAYAIGIMLSFVVPLAKDEFAGTASKDRYY